ncbi:MAG: thiamine phosphate synthase [Opitutaceae bacterium]|nr:thiamine phosphate synthase [Cytophagales bacterium]
MENEIGLINQLFKSGLQRFHLRKPDVSKEHYESILKSISPENKRKIVLHQYHELAGKYNVKGLHLREVYRKSLNERQIQDLKKELKKKNLSFSSSFHSLEELEKTDGLFDYILLSPVFESISKPGYASENVFNPTYKKLKTPVIALGGIQSNNIGKVKELGFDGIAVLGAVWQNTQRAVTQLQEIQKEYSKHFTNSLNH